MFLFMYISSNRRYGCCHSSPESQGVELKIIKKIVSNKLLASEEGRTSEQLLLTVRAPRYNVCTT